MAKKSAREIVLSATRGSWRMSGPHADEGDRRFHSIREQILKRDDYTCRYCQFKAKRYQELHHLDDNHGRNTPENVVTACCLCHQCYHLGMAGVRNSGVLVWLPEFSQADLNNICRTLFVASGGVHAESANELYRALEARRAVIDLEMGQGASNPAALGQAFLEMDREVYATRAKRLGGLRLLPRMQGFSLQVAYWRSDPEVFGNKVDAKWDSVMPAPMRAEIERLIDPDSEIDIDESEDGFDGQGRDDSAPDRY
jgi:intracellular multiplication protein IcmJ